MGSATPEREREAFLRVTPVIDWDQPSVLALADELSQGAGSQVDTARACFEWVRDEIPHTSDHALDPITCSASEVLKERTGFCYAKSHLLAALLRANGIPTGFVYQRLALDARGKTFCLHGLNAVWLPEIGWYRIDSRGNRPDLNAGFDPPNEILPFACSVTGERIFLRVFPDPARVVLDALRRFGTRAILEANLPDATDLDQRALRVRYASGLELELGLAGLRWANVDPVDPGTASVVAGGAVILVDKRGRLAALRAGLRPGTPVTVETKSDGGFRGQTEMKIRNAVDGDILQMHNVRMSVVENRLTNPLSIEPHHYESLLSSGRGWVCEVDERIVGFAIADPANCSIWALFVHPDCEGRGIGRELHDIAIQWLFGNGAARIWLTTDPNTRAERFYKAAHWQYVGRQANGEARYEMTADQFAKRST